MRMKVFVVLLAALAGVSQSSLAVTITVSGYEDLNRRMEASHVQGIGGVEISAGGNISLESGVGGVGYTTPLLGGDIQVESHVTPLIAGLVIDRTMVTIVPEPQTYAMLLAGLGLVGLASRRRE